MTRPSVPVSHRSVDTGHGRREVRTIQVTRTAYAGSMGSALYAR